MKYREKLPNMDVLCPYMDIKGDFNTEISGFSIFMLHIHQFSHHFTSIWGTKWWGTLNWYCFYTKTICTPSIITSLYPKDLGYNSRKTVLRTERWILETAWINFNVPPSAPPIFYCKPVIDNFNKAIDETIPLFKIVPRSSLRYLRSNKTTV